MPATDPNEDNLRLVLRTARRGRRWMQKALDRVALILARVNTEGFTAAHLADLARARANNAALEGDLVGFREVEEEARAALAGPPAEWAAAFTRCHGRLCGLLADVYRKAR